LQKDVFAHHGCSLVTGSGWPNGRGTVGYQAETTAATAADSEGGRAMPWLIGIDEAGYGPNLGPLVMSAVACRVPEALAGADLWRLLATAVRHDGDPTDGRPLVADSKVVHAGPQGLAALELGVLGSVRPANCETPLSLGSYLEWVSPD